MTTEEIRAAVMAHCEAGRAALSEKQIDAAREHFEAAYDACDSLRAEDSPSFDGTREFARICLQIGKTLSNSKAFGWARSFYQDARDARRSVWEKTGTLSDKRELADAVELLCGTCTLEDESFSLACRKELCRLRQEIWEETGDLADRRGLASALFNFASEVERSGSATAKEHYHNAHFHWEAVVTEGADPNDVRELALCGYETARFLKRLGDMSGALQFAEKVRSRTRALYDETADLADARRHVGICCRLAKWAAERNDVAALCALAKECFTYGRRVIAESKLVFDRHIFIMDSMELATLLWKKEKHAVAREAWEEAYAVCRETFDHTEKTKDRRDLASSWGQLADAALVMGEASREEECRVEALSMDLTVFRETGDEQDGKEAAETALALADLKSYLDEQEEACRYYKIALSVAQKVSWDEGIQMARKGLEGRGS